MIRTLFILGFLFLPSSVLAFGGRNRCNTCYHQPVYYAPRVVVEEKLIIPVRNVRFSEIKGLNILQDLNNKEYISVNGRIINSPQTITEEVTEKVQNDKIIIERKITQ